MYNNRPKLYIESSNLDIFIELVAAVAVLFNIAVAIYGWFTLPDIIPTHFNIIGEVDGYGSRNSILFLPILSGLLYTLFSIFSNYSHIFNYAVKITDSNAYIQYKLAKTFLSIIKSELIILFGYIELAIIISALNHKNTLLGIASLLAITLIFLITTGYYIYQSIKAK